MLEKELKTRRDLTDDVRSSMQKEIDKLKLEAKGYLRRQRSDEDERVVLACLTDEGRALKERAKHIPCEMAECLQSFSKEDAKELYRLLYKLIGIMDELEKQ